MIFLDQISWNLKSFPYIGLLNISSNEMKFQLEPCRNENVENFSIFVRSTRHSSRLNISIFWRDCTFFSIFHLFFSSNSLPHSPNWACVEHCERRQKKREKIERKNSERVSETKKEEVEEKYSRAKKLIPLALNYYIVLRIFLVLR